MLWVLLLAVPLQPSWAGSADFVYCLERGHCALTNLCTFMLPADPSRCFRQTCTNMTGHLMELKNGLDYAINVTWDVIGSTGAAPIPSAAASVVHDLYVEAQSVRYFNTFLEVPHTLRLMVDGETVATVLTHHDSQCTEEETCDNLLRACYGPTTDPNCVEYARHCHGFAKADDSRRDLCIPSCLATYYDHLIRNPYSIDSDALVDLLVRIQAQRGGGGAGGELTAAELTSSLDQCGSSKNGPCEEDAAKTSSVTTWLVVTVIILLVLGGLTSWYIIRVCRQRSQRHHTSSAEYGL
jgi:hypothetical protein